MKKQDRGVVIWLLSGCLLIFLMVVVGGITRLTNSGLSMTDWHLVTDAVPPTTPEKWQQAFDAYKRYPEYKLINSQKNFTLEDYKFIYFWEWFHRLIGRVIGLVFIVPFLYFLLRRKLDRHTLKQCLILLGLGALQGFFGWFMVKSGLVDNPDVSHFRLALHLITAFVTFAYTFWVALDLIYPQRRKAVFPLRNAVRWALGLLLVQIMYGAFVAGLNAGLIHNHWPLMSDGQFFHDSILLERDSVFRAFTEGKSGVQFVHRTLAYFVVAAMALVFFRSRKSALDKGQANGIATLLAVVLIQFALGVLTLLYGVPLWLGLLHQITAFLLLATTTYVLHRVSK